MELLPGIHELLGFSLAGFALIGSPGPATLSLAATGAAFGAGRGFRYMTGVIFGLISVICIVASGVAGVMLALPGVAPVLGGVAAAYIVYLAYRIATTRPLEDDSSGRTEPSFLKGVLLSLVNPKGYAAMTALFSGFVLIEGHQIADAALKLLVLLPIMTCVDVAWLFAGAALTRAFHEPAMNRAINLTFATLLVGSVIFAFLL